VTGTDEPTISFLLTELADLERAGREAGAPAETTSLFQRTRERIRYLVGTAEELQAGDLPKPRSLSGVEELPNALADLVAAGIEADAPAWVTNLLCTTHMRLSSQLTADSGRGGGEDSRLTPRFNEDQPARLMRANGRELAVRLVDRSPLGLGLLSEESLDPHELIRLLIEKAQPQERHLGEVVFCLEQGKGTFHVGVELLASE